FSRAEMLAIPVTIAILALAFGAFVAALLPVVLALTAFIAATGLAFIASKAFPIDHSTFSVMLLIGLAVGVDYSLFYIRREREERAAGRSADAALQAAAATSGRSVLISGLTVIVAVAGLFFTGTGEFRGIAAGTANTPGTPAIRDALTRFPAQALATSLVQDPISVHVIDRHVAIICAPLAGTSKDTPLKPGARDTALRHHPHNPRRSRGRAD